MNSNKLKFTASVVSAVMLVASFAGCKTDPEPAVTESTWQTTTTVTEAVTEAVTTTEEEELTPVEYPCEYTEQELHCTYGDYDIYGTLYTPENGRKTHPAVILNHGYNCIGDDMKDIATKLAKNGIVSYTFDYCGGSTRSKSSGESVDMSIETEQEDLRQVIDMIAKLESVDESKIYLYGESQGGFVAALTGAEMPDRIAGMFLIYPAFCIPDQWLAMDPETMNEPFAFMGAMTLSRAFYDGVPRYDVYEHISKFTNPVLIYQGDKDNVVSLSYADKIDEAFPDSTLTIFKGAGHGFGGADKKAMMDGITEFFSGRGINQ